jgi:hypothetical protein
MEKRRELFKKINERPPDFNKETKVRDKRREEGNRDWPWWERKSRFRPAGEKSRYGSQAQQRRKSRYEMARKAKAPACASTPYGVVST